MKRLVLYCLASLSFALPALAFAADAYVTGNVNMRAGPDTSYPLIDQVPAGSDVDVQGCTQGWEWCDVISANNRGWVAGNYIEYNYQNQSVLLPSYGSQIGIPIVSFVIGTYWDNYYRNRPFYRQRATWYRRPYVRRPPPRPLPHPVRPGRPGRPGMPGGPGNRPGHLGPVGPGQGLRPTPGNRPNPGRPSQGNRPQRPGGQRPNPGQGPRPNPGQGPRPNPGNAGRPGGSSQRPPMQRPSPGARPAPAGRPSGQRPGGGGNRPPAKAGNGGKSGDKKDDRGH
ncbi:SH3 domain-containing protein [Rhodanobacter sp. L36]|uniref:SH3 domain-containing protein n=1 Tax=Rhodanobacter sp. L36 TaxID=1747221 RepID=UPI00131D8CEC|nr:SH3 domain-containing protein [Rhodanobacter sp. L36]